MLYITLATVKTQLYIRRMTDKEALRKYIYIGESFLENWKIYFDFGAVPSDINFSGASYLETVF